MSLHVLASGALISDPQRCEGLRARQELLERSSLHPGEHDRRTFDDEVPHRHEVGMIERAHRAYLAIETGDGITAASAHVPAGEHLHCHALPAHDVEALEHSCGGG